MILEQLRLADFRNIAQATLDFGPGVNLVTGGNGQGKSNLLEAIGVLASGRSYRGAGPGILRRAGCGGFSLAGRCLTIGVRHELAFYAQSERRGARVDGKALSSYSEMGHVFATVVYSPESLRLIRGAPGDRRRYLDWQAFTGQRVHARLAADFKKALSARNRLLQTGVWEQGEMEAWEGQLTAAGAGIALGRAQALARLSFHLAAALPCLALDPGRFALRLESQLLAEGEEGAEALALRYADLLETRRRGDGRMGMTTVGPHRDEVALLMDGMPMFRYASQGEQKRFLLALTLAEGAMAAELLGAAPPLLLDDPAAEVDRVAVARFLEGAGQRGHQLFMTAIEEGQIPSHGGRHHRVEGGAFTVLQES